MWKRTASIKQMAKRSAGVMIVSLLAWIIVDRMWLQSSVRTSFGFHKLTRNIRPDQKGVDLSIRTEGNIYWVVGNGTTLADRVLEFQSEIAKIREQFVSYIASPRNDYRKQRLVGVKRRVWAADKDTLYQLKNEKNIVSVALTWIDSNNSLTDSRNLVLSKYYKWADDKELCMWKSKSEALCTSNQTVPPYPGQINFSFLNLDSVPREELISPSVGDLFQQLQGVAALPHIFYVHLIAHGTVDEHGNVLTQDIKIFPLSCGRSQMTGSSDDATVTSSILFYDEVFVASLFWGSAVYHNLIESLPRLAPYVHFLKSSPEIKIHIVQNRQLTASALDVLGLQASRLVSGLVQANVVYVPQGTRCGKPGVQSSQLLSQMYRDILKEKYPPAPLELKRNSIVVIKRTQRRFFKEASEIEAMVRDLAEKSGLRYELSADNPVPSLEETMKMFSRATIVVAPHGAGLSNLLFSEPGTLVIEGICNPPYVRLCLQRTAYVLGHKHHALLSKGGCESSIDISPSLIEKVLTFYIKQKTNK